MPRERRKASTMIDALRSHAVDIDGVLWVPAQSALPDLCLRPTWHYELDRNFCERLMVPVEPSSACPRGCRLYYRLDDLEAYAKRVTSNRSNFRWREDDDALLYSLLGRRTVDQIAKRLHRTRIAVKNRILSLGWTEAKVIQDRDNRIRTEHLARILRVCPSAVRRWRSIGMPAHAYASTRRGGAEYYHDLREVRDWVVTRPESLVRLHPEVRRMLHITPADIESRQEAA